MRNKILKLLVSGMAAISLITACGSSSSADSNAMYKSAVAEGSAPMAAAAEADYDYADGLAVEESAEYRDEAGTGSTNVEEGGAQSSRKLITRMNIEAETEELDPLVARIEARAVALGGYIESSSVYTSTSYYSSDRTGREADVTARIPAKKLNEFIAELEGSSNITSRSRNVEDVTLSYVDTQAHKDALEAEKQSLLKLMDSAKSIEDIMAIETRLTDVRYELESIERQLRSYDNQIDYSTVYMNLREVKVYTPQESATVADRISKGFRESLNSVATGCVDFAVFFITHLPQFVVFIVVIIIIVLIIRALIAMLRKSRGKRKEKRQSRAAAKNTPGKLPVQPQESSAAVNTEKPSETVASEKAPSVDAGSTNGENPASNEGGEDKTTEK